jgi:predicted transcriptional regulator
MPNQTPSPSANPEQLLGDLESAIMQVVWQQPEVTVRAVQAALQPTRPLAYTTVLTVMSRLAQKGVLIARKDGKTHYFRPAAPTPDAFVAARAQQAVQELLANYGDVGVAQFLQALEGVDPARLAALRALAREESADES